jgi:hypothetical protein
MFRNGHRPGEGAAYSVGKHHATEATSPPNKTQAQCRLVATNAALTVLPALPRQ